MSTLEEIVYFLNDHPQFLAIRMAACISEEALYWRVFKWLFFPPFKCEQFTFSIHRAGTIIKKYIAFFLEGKTFL